MTIAFFKLFVFFEKKSRPVRPDGALAHHFFPMPKRLLSRGIRNRGDFHTTIFIKNSAPFV